MKVDLATGKASTILERKGVAAVLIIPGTRLMLSTNWDSNTATLFNRDTGAVTADIPTGKGPDGAFYDAASGLAFVMNGESGDATVIDIASAKGVATIALAEAPEAGVPDGKGKAYINLEASNEIAVVDIAGRRVITRYNLPGCEEPTGIAFDPATNLLISACHNGVAKLIDAKSGADKGSITIGKGADGSLFDPKTRTGFVPSIDGQLAIYQLDTKGVPHSVQMVTTREGARTAAYDDATHKLYLPAATIERDAKGEYVSATRDFSVLTVSQK
jgi:DNA-binding beta-propeller fold protein YncE